MIRCFLSFKIAFGYNPMRYLSTSAQNPTSWKLRDTKYPAHNYGLEGMGKRGKYALYRPKIEGEVLFGHHPVTLALEAEKRKFHKLFLKQENYYCSQNRLKSGQELKFLEICENKKVQVEYVLDSTLVLLSGNRPHQDVCLDVSPLPVNHATLIESELRKEMVKDGSVPAVWLMPIEVKDLMNLGNMVRSAYYLGVDTVLLSRYSAPPNPIVSKASSGALEVQDIQRLPLQASILQFLQLWKDCGGKVVGTVCHMEGENNMPASRYTVDAPTLLLTGNEGRGLPDDIEDFCDTKLHLCRPDNTSPTNPKIDSLNLSVATGIILHTVMHSRKPLVQQHSVQMQQDPP